MSEAMTADELLAIAEEHWLHSVRGCDGRPLHRQRGSLLDLLRQVGGCFNNGAGLYREDCCQFCGADIAVDPGDTVHRPDCLAPLLEVLKRIKESLR